MEIVEGSETTTIEYEYNEQGIRTSKTVNGVETNYLIDELRPYAQVVEEYDALGNPVASYTYGLDLISQQRNGVSSFYHVDGLGSTRVLTNVNGSATDSYTYDAFGNVVGVAGTTENSYLFAGEQFDGTLGQYYLRQRYYDPSSGRFTRRDTYEGRLGEPVTLHKYIYANADPVNGIDPSGLFTLTMGSDIYAIAGILATLTYIQLSQNSPEQLGGFGEGPSPKSPSHTGHRPTESLLQRVLTFPGRNAGPKLEHTETFPTNTWEDFVQHVFNSSGGERDWKQDKMLSKGEIEKLKNAGEDIHILKGRKNSSKRDLYKDAEGNIYVKPKGGKGPGEETGLNINDF